METSKHVVYLPGDTNSSTLHLSTDTSNSRSTLPKDAALRVLSVVDVAQIPLHMIFGSLYSVTTNSDAVQKYFESILLSQSKPAEDWWQTAQSESSLGVLLSVQVDGADQPLPRVTELLIIAVKSQSIHAQRLPTPPASSPNAAEPETAGPSNNRSTLQVRALALSSDFLYPFEAPTLPLSPISGNTDTIPAVFLSPSFHEPTETIHEPPTKKRRTATCTLDAATERRKTARHSGGESVSAAAAPKSDGLPLTHRRSTSGSQPIPLQTRPSSRSPSISSSRPGSVRGLAPGEPARRSTLSRVQSLSVLPNSITGEEDTEVKNKETISRIVMAGMRLYGLSQSKRRSKSRPSVSGTLSPAFDSSFEELENDRKQDEEYKLIYHQLFKGVCFAFRMHMGKMSLQPHTDALRELADKLLGVYCSDPLAEGLPEAPDKLTPGGRKAFGSAQTGENRSPFAAG